MGYDAHVTDTLPGTHMPTGEAARWAGAIVPVYLVFGAAGIAVTMAAAAANLALLIAAAGAVGVASLVLSARLRALRRMGPTATRLRLVVAGIHLVVGLAFLLLGSNDTLSFLGIAFLARFGTEVLSEARYSRRWMVTRGWVGLALAVLLILLGLGPIGGVSAPAGLALVVFGVAAAAVATELHTEDWLDVHRSGESTLLLARGAFALAGAAVALLVYGVEPAYVAILVVGMAVVVALVASDSDTGVLLGLGLVALVWALAPRTDEGQPEPMQLQPDDEVIVAFGDSYISGEGARQFIEGTNETNSEKGNQCRRAPTAYSLTLAEQATAVEIPDKVLFLGCSGALAVDLWGVRQNRTEPIPQLTQYHDAVSDDRGPEDTRPDFALDEANVTAVLLTLGGNDAGFGDLGKACLAPGSCSSIGARFVDRLDDLGRRLDVAYTRLEQELDGVPRDADGNLPVYVMAYPMPVKGSGCWWTVLSKGDRDFIRAFVDDLNDTVQAVAQEHGFKFVAGVESSFVKDRLRICDRSTPRGLGMNFIALNPVSGRLIDVVNPKNWIHNSFHPNEVGHEAMRKTVEAALTGGETLGVDTNYEELSAAELVTQCPDAVTQDGEPSGQVRPAQCDQATSDWAWSQTLRVVRKVAPIFGLGLVGAWWLLLPAIRRAQQERWSLPTLLRRAARWVRDRVRGPKPAV